MADLKLKIKKLALVRKIEGQKVTGYFGRVITNGKKSFDEIARQSAKNTTLHPKEASLAAELLLEGICEEIKQGIIVDLGPLGTLYPAVKSKWEQDPEDLKLSDMQPKVNYKPSDGIESAINGASLSWATEKEEAEGTDTPSGDDDVQGGDNGGNDGGGGNNPGGSDLEG